MHRLVFTCCSFQLLRRATPTNRMPVSSSMMLHRFDTLQQCDRRLTTFTEGSIVLMIVTNCRQRDNPFALSTIERGNCD